LTVFSAFGNDVLCLVDTEEEKLRQGISPRITWNAQIVGENLRKAAERCGVK